MNKKSLLRFSPFQVTASALAILAGGVLLAAYGGESHAGNAMTTGTNASPVLLATSPFPFPRDGTGMVPLWPASQAPIESIQFTLPDGTLVTRFGLVGRNRHARERGEAWNELGYGPNDTVDANGNPLDKGPGHYLDFVKNYFKNRTWGVEIIDNSRVAGVAVPSLRINNYFLEAQRAGGRSFFHRFDSPNVTGFGWMSPGKLKDPKLYGVDAANCPVVPRPPNGALLRPDTILNDGCSATVDSFPGHDALSADANGVLVASKNVLGATRFYDYAVTNGVTGVAVAGTNVPGRRLKVGDAVEFTQAFFSTPEAMLAVGDNGAFHYYTTEVTYVVGVGLRPWYGVQPRLNSAPLPDETLQGGIGSVSYDYSDGSTFVFQQPQNNIGMQDIQRFVEGRRLLHSNMTTGEHNEPGNDRDTAVVGLQGPSFNQSSCFACHVNNGRGPAPAALSQRLDQMVVRVATIDAKGQQLPDPNYGVTVQMNGYDAHGKLVDLGDSVRVGGFDTHSVSLADGTAVELRKPTLSFAGPVPSVASLRAAQPIVGMGLLEAIPEADILARVRATPDEDGVKGQANFVFDPDTGVVRLGRFGWKAGKFSLRHQTASALLEDMSVTTTIFPSLDCLSGPATCKSAPPDKGLLDADLLAISRYLALVAVPAQRSIKSGFPKGVSPLPHLDVDPDHVAAGAAVFQAVRCASCHTAQMTTGSGHEFQELREQAIKPYTDLLLHDMGPDLADNYAEGLASGKMWRTQPLWGIGYTERVMGTGGSVGYLHDGRARTLTEAVMWHGGEAERARQRFSALSTADRQALLAFLQSL
ncbi:di-heme oxidoreductase family protein [Dyella sp. 2RAB6]|uniref:di-heme oxidoreductase family protein n=1 Tax=Dyella sp. 2RAB6 TaxID=3232992 RepID=UPI003F93C6E4